MLQFTKSLRNYEQKQSTNKQRKSYVTPRRKPLQENQIDANSDNMLTSTTALTFNLNNSNSNTISNLKILSMQTGDELKSKSLIPLKRASINLNNTNDTFIDKLSDKRLFDRQYRLFANASSNTINQMQCNKNTTSTSSFIKSQSPVKQYDNKKAAIVEVNYTVKNKFSSNLDLLVLPKDMKAVLTPNSNVTKSRNVNIASLSNINNKSLKENQQVFSSNLTRSFYQKVNNKIEALPTIENSPKKTEMKRTSVTVNIKNGASSNIQLGNLNINSVELAPASAKRKPTPANGTNQAAGNSRNRFVNSRYLYFSKSTSFESQTLETAPQTQNNLSKNCTKKTRAGFNNSIETQSSEKTNSEQLHSQQQNVQQQQKTIQVDMSKIFDLVLNKSEEVDETNFATNAVNFHTETKMNIVAVSKKNLVQIEQVKHDEEVLNEEYDEQAELAYLNEVKRKVSDWLDKYVIPFWNKSKA